MTALLLKSLVTANTCVSMGWLRTTRARVEICASSLRFSQQEAAEIVRHLELRVTTMASGQNVGFGAVASSTIANTRIAEATAARP